MSVARRRERVSTTISINGGPEIDATAALDNAGAARFVDRLVALQEEAIELRRTIREVLEEAKDAGYHTGAIREVVKRKLEDDEQRAKREDKELAVKLILTALGEFRGTPLGNAAVERAAA